MVLSRVTSLLVGIPVRQRFRVDQVLAMVEAAGFQITGREVVRLKMPLVFIEATAS